MGKKKKEHIVFDGIKRIKKNFNKKDLIKLRKGKKNNQQS